MFGSGAGGVTQVVEYLPSKCEALSSNSGTKKKKMLGRIFKDIREVIMFYSLKKVIQCNSANMKNCECS
jgi:hypothetical protein